jgi:hypothetical protein
MGRLDSAARSNLLPKPLDLGGEAPHSITELVDLVTPPVEPPYFCFSRKQKR